MVIGLKFSEMIYDYFSQQKILMVLKEPCRWTKAGGSLNWDSYSIIY